MRARSASQQTEWASAISIQSIPTSSPGTELTGSPLIVWVPQGAVVDLELYISKFTHNGANSTFSFSADGNVIGGGYFNKANGTIEPFVAKGQYRRSGPGAFVRFSVVMSNGSASVTLGIDSFNGTSNLRAKVTQL